MMNYLQQRKEEEKTTPENISDRTVNLRFYPFEDERVVEYVRNMNYLETNCIEIVDSYLVVHKYFSREFY